VKVANNLVLENTVF